MSKLQTNITNLQNLLEAVNALPEAGGEQATPVISVSSNGLITATAGSKTSTHQLAFQAAKTITPSTASQIAVSSGYYTGGDVTVAGDSNLVAENIKSGVNIFGVNGNYVGSGGGDTNIENSIIARTISSYTNDEVTSIGNYAFCSCTRLTTVSFPNVTSIGNYAFGYCTSLTTVSFPNATSINIGAFSNCYSLTTASFPAATTIGNHAFYSCSSLTTVSFPNVTTIGNNAFAYCRSLTTVSFPAVTSISSNAFYSCSNLTTVSFPVATFIGSSAFGYCYKLTTANFPKVTTISSSAFYSCNSLTTASFPVATEIGSNAFGYCYKLTTASFPKATTIGGSAFRYCYNLKSLYLTGSSLCQLSNSNVFTATPIGGYSASAGTYGSIYVPTSLLTSYKAATNWTYFSSRFVGI
jgi:hypothetical protein